MYTCGQAHLVYVFVNVFDICTSVKAHIFLEKFTWSSSLPWKGLLYRFVVKYLK